jgi:hypothetical protein
MKPTRVNLRVGKSRGVGDVVPRRSFPNPGFGFLFALLTGCSEEPGPVRVETARVTGVVKDGSRPIEKGWVEFLPVDGTVGNMRSAPLGPGGRFEADGVAVGWNRVGIAGAGLPRPKARFFDPLGSPIRRKVPKKETAPIAIDLLDELAANMPERQGG